MPTLESRKMAIGLGLVGLVAGVPSVAVAGSTAFAALTGTDLGIATLAATAAALGGGLLAAWRVIAQTLDAVRGELDEVRGAVQRLRDGDGSHELVPGEYTADLAVAVRELRGTLRGRQQRLEDENRRLARQLAELGASRAESVATHADRPLPQPTGLMLAG
ncbi:MAG: hypothetical protein FJ102_10805 [Deltaproteobacteria bacterium]|nr:hypothetical protein [Deltaproteobacteria bacterium]